jgi:hypothetical protein
VIPVALGGAAILALIAAAWPVATYTITLSLFGLAHVLSELRYVDERFGARIAGGLRGAIGLLLALVVVGRLLAMTGLVEKGDATAAELVWVALLAAVAVPVLWRTAGAATAFSGMLALGLLAGAAWSATHVFLALAVLHNLTPLGFFAERLEGPGRKEALAVAAFVMLGVPMLLATGLPSAVIGMDLGSPWGGLSKHVGAFVHADFHEAWWAPNLFAAAAYGQCVHYVATIGILPRLGGGEGTLPWPSRTSWVLGLCGFALIGLAGFWQDFGQTRQIYGVLAAVHAWIEVPVLLIGLGMRPVPAPAPPPVPAEGAFG